MSRLSTKQRRARRRRLLRYWMDGAMSRSERNAADLQRQSMDRNRREYGYRPVRLQSAPSWW
jgi:hypothetical protein